MTILSIFVCLLSVLSCGSDNEETEVAVIDVSPAQLSATHEGLVTSATINSGLEWTAFSDDACKDWISCKITDNGSQGTVEVTVKANTTYQSREGKVVVKAGAARTSIPVTQAARPEPSADPDITVPEGYRLVWNEEFNKGTQPDLAQWYYETGGNGWGNNELQHYVAGNQGNEQLAAIKDGILSIIAKKIGETVYSIRMNTKESWKYGYFEARLKLPTGKGTWPAFWMMPKNYTAWPDDGEIAKPTTTPSVRKRPARHSCLPHRPSFMSMLWSGRKTSSAPSWTESNFSASTMTRPATGTPGRSTPPSI